MSAPQMTTAEALRAALASTIACSAQELQEAVGQVVVATAAELPASAPAGADARSVFDPQARTTVLLADRIPAGQEAQALAEEIERHHGRQVAQAILGDRADELLGVAGAEVLNELAGQFQSGYPEDPRTTFRYVRDQLLTYASDRRHFNVPAWEFLKEMDASQQQAFILSKVVPVLRDAEWPKEGSEQLQEALLAVVGKYWSNPATTAVLQAGRIPADGGGMEQSRQSGYVIRLLGESETDLDGSAGEFWSNEDGWGSLKGATLFTASERQSFHLPIFQERESEWISIERARDLVSGRPLLEEVPVELVLGDSAAELLGGDGKVSNYIETQQKDVFEKRIVGVFTKQAWGGRKGDDAIFVSDEQFDATDAVLKLSHAELIELQDNHESTDEIGRSIVGWDGPCEVRLVGSIQSYFGVESIEDVTPEMLAQSVLSLDVKVSNYIDQPQQPVSAIAARIAEALPANSGYEKGYKDALESIVLALSPKMAASLDEAVETALDAYSNNVDDPATAGEQPVRSVSDATLLSEINRRGMLQPLYGAIGAMHDHLDRTGALDERLSQYLAYRLRREEAAITGMPDSPARVANWQECIDQLDCEARAVKAEDSPSPGM